MSGIAGNFHAAYIKHKAVWDTNYWQEEGIETEPGPNRRNPFAGMPLLSESNLNWVNRIRNDPVLVEYRRLLLQKKAYIKIILLQPSKDEARDLLRVQVFALGALAFFISICFFPTLFVLKWVGVALILGSCLSIPYDRFLELYSKYCFKDLLNQKDVLAKPKRFEEMLKKFDKEVQFQNIYATEIQNMRKEALRKLK